MGPATSPLGPLRPLDGLQVQGWAPIGPMALSRYPIDPGEPTPNFGDPTLQNLRSLRTPARRFRT